MPNAKPKGLGISVARPRTANPFPAAAARRTRRAFGELLEWLDGHPLTMRLILPGEREIDYIIKIVVIEIIQADQDPG
jgi:hypothetical protein